jgi:hypothetical protein
MEEKMLFDDNFDIFKAFLGKNHHPQKRRQQPPRAKTAASNKNGVRNLLPKISRKLVEYILILRCG